jgi:parvulin-like peptidyl-prolyl isomerase
MKIFLNIVSAALILNCTLSFAQNDESTVAQIGNEIITAKEFKLRYELSPYIPADKNIDPDSIKYDFLYSLIAEKLWAKDAEEMGITKTDEFNFIFKPLEEIFVRDALFKIEVEDKVLLSANDIENGIIKSQAKLKAQILSTQDSAMIYNLYYKLNPDTNYDSLISYYQYFTNNVVDISLGTLKDEEIEDSLYSLPVNGFTAPIKSEVGWVIFIIRNKIFTPIDLSNQQAIDNMKKVIRNRRIKKRYDEYLKQLLSGITINIDAESFNFIYSAIWSILKNKSSIDDSTNYFELSEFDFSRIKSILGKDILNKQLFMITKKEVSVESFISNLVFNGFHIIKLDSIIALQKLNQSVKRFVEAQMITEEAYKLGLQLTPLVRQDLTLWKENYLAQLYFNNNLDSINISDNDVYNYYLDELVNASNIRLINIRLVSIKDLDEVSNIFELLKQGTDFGDLVKSYGSTDSLVNNEGETGLKPILLLGYVGSVASELELNEIYGPIKRNNAYTILQVIERQESNDSLKLSFESVRNQLRNDLRFKALNQRLTKKTSDLAQQNNVKIFNDVVDKIKPSQIPMFVHRLMGFGGRIAGVPLTTPFSGWINEEVKQKLLP